MELKYTKSVNGKYLIEGINLGENNNTTYLELYKRFERAVTSYGYKKFKNQLTVLDLETRLKSDGDYRYSDMITTLRKTRNLLVHSDISITVSDDMIIKLIKLIINVEEFTLKY